jgi:hypothetical protein
MLIMAMLKKTNVYVVIHSVDFNYLIKRKIKNNVIVFGRDGNS